METGKRWEALCAEYLIAQDEHSRACLQITARFAAAGRQPAAPPSHDDVVRLTAARSRLAEIDAKMLRFINEQRPGPIETDDRT